MAIIWKVSANPIYILTNNDVPVLSSAKVIVQCYNVDDDSGVETPQATGFTNAIGTNCTVTRLGNVATITGVSANNGSVDLYAQSGVNFRMFTIPFFLVKFIGKAQITISIVDDGYTINCTPSNIVIPANADGSNPILTGAKTRVLLSKAGVNIPVTITSIVATGCTASHATNEATITTVSALTGNLQINFKTTGDPYESYVNVPFSTSKNGNDGLPGQNGKDGISVILSNEVHALPANHDGSVSQASIDTAVCSITVLKGSMPLTPVAANATPGIGQFRYNIQSFPGGTAVRVRDIYNSDTNNTFKLATITASVVKIKVFIYAESLANPIEREMTVTKVNGADPTEFEEVRDIFYGWKVPGKVTINGAMLEAESVRAAAIIVENLFAKHFQTNNIGARTTINVLPIDATNPTSNENYYKADAIRQYHQSGRISMYEGIVTGVVIKVNGINRTVDGHAKVVFKDEVGSPILYVVDSYTQNGGLQYNSGADTVQYFQISGHRLISSSLGASASNADLINVLFALNPSSSIYTPRSMWCGYYEYTQFYLYLGLSADSGSVWKRVSTHEDTMYVTANNGLTPIASGWYYRLGDVMSGRSTYEDDRKIVFNLNIQLYYINSGGEVGVIKNLTINNIQWDTIESGGNTCGSGTPQIQIDSMP
jgi:hypothetical protein